MTKVLDHAGPTGTLQATILYIFILLFILLFIYVSIKSHDNFIAFERLVSHVNEEYCASNLYVIIQHDIKVQNKTAQ